MITLVMAATERIGAVLFDYAGTLFMTRPGREMVAAAAAGRLGDDELDALAEAYERAGLPGGVYPDAIPPELAHAYEIRDLGPEQNERAYVGLLEAAGEPWPGFAHAVYRQILDPATWVPYADARRVVDALLADGIACGVVSNIAFDIRPVLRAHGLGALAERCALSFEVGAAKPDRRLFEVALELVGCAPEETLMVGDYEPTDGAAAALGMPVLILPLTPAGSVHGLDAVLRAALPPRTR
jgi:putative hydrolase of the HAD superfamily